MADRSLSGAELVASSQSTSDKSFPLESCGQKEYEPDGSWLQDKRIEKALSDRRFICDQERVTAIINLTLGEWMADLHKVLVTKETGKFWYYMGHVEDKKKYLYPEEALLLMDQGRLEVSYGGVPLSIKEAYSLFLDADCSFEYYQIYANLARLGYMVMRHEEPRIVTSYERKLGIDSYEKNPRKRRHEKKRKSKKYDSDVKEKKRKKDLDRDKAEEADEEILPARMEYADLVSFTDRLEEEKPVEPTTEQPMEASNEQEEVSSRIAYSDWEVAHSYIPCIKDISVITLPRPPDDLLADGMRWPGDNVLLDVSQLPRKQSDTRYEDMLIYSHGREGVKARVKARNWGEYKEAYNRLLEDSWLNVSPAAHLWLGDDVTPLVSPQDAFCTAAVLDKLKVIENTSFSSKNIRSSEEEVNIIFDLYLPNQKFRKSQPGRPDLRVALYEGGHCVPDLRTMMQYHQYCTDGVLIIWAVYDNSELSFYSFHDIDLPRDVTIF